MARRFTIPRSLFVLGGITGLSLLPIGTSLTAELAPDQACAEGAACVPEAGSYCVDPISGEVMSNHRSKVTIE